jgi:hypothetical protein
MKLLLISGLLLLTSAIQAQSNPLELPCFNKAIEEAQKASGSRTATLVDAEAMGDDMYYFQVKTGQVLFDVLVYRNGFQEVCELLDISKVQ